MKLKQPNEFNYFELQKSKKYQTFNDGTAYIYEIKNVAEKGNQPKLGLSEKVNLRFKFKTVGMTRFFTAQQNEINIAETIIVPQSRKISVHDVVILTTSKERQYAVEQVQHKDDTFPKTSLITLSELEEVYDTNGI